MACQRQVVGSVLSYRVSLASCDSALGPKLLRMEQLAMEVTATCSSDAGLGVLPTTLLIATT